MDTCKEIGTRIKIIREQNGETQAVVAKALNVKRETVAQWEAGARDLKTEYTIKLADHFGISCDEILRGIPTEHLDIYKETGLSERAINNLKFIHFRSEDHTSGGDAITAMDKIKRELLDLLEGDLFIFLHQLSMVRNTRSVSCAELKTLVAAVKSVEKSSSEDNFRSSLLYNVEELKRIKKELSFSVYEFSNYCRETINRKYEIFDFLNAIEKLSDLLFKACLVGGNEALDSFIDYAEEVCSTYGYENT